MEVAERLRRTASLYGRVLRVEGNKVVTNRPVCDVCHGWLHGKRGNRQRHKVCAFKDSVDTLARYILNHRGPDGSLKEPPFHVVLPHVNRLKYLPGIRYPTSIIRAVAMERAKRLAGAANRDKV